MGKDATVKVARQRLSVLEMAETLGEHLGGMPPRRHGSNELLRMGKTHGLEGLKDMVTDLIADPL